MKTAYPTLRSARSALLVLVAASSLATLPLATSCANANATGDEPDAAPSVIPGNDGASGVTDASVDACGDGDASCTGYAPPCEETEWCPLETGADPRRALTSIWGSGKDDVWAVGAAGSVIHWDGASWRDFSTGSSYTLFGVGGSGPSDVWAVSTPAIFFHGGVGSDGGTAWTPMPTLAPDYAWDLLPALTSVWALSPDDVWIGGGDKINFPSIKLWHKIPDPEGGVAWQGVATCEYNGDCAVIRAIWGSSASDVWAVGDRGKSYRARTVSYDAEVPTVFDLLETQATAALRGVWGTGPDDVWAVGNRGTIRHHRAGVGPWEIVPSPTQQDLRAVWGSSKDDVWAVGDDGTVLHFDGSSWSSSPVSLPPGPKPNLYGIWGSGPDDVWIVGEGIVLRFTERRNAGAELTP